MNAASKTVDNAHFFQGDWRIVSVGRSALVCMVLIIALLLSALGVVQLKNMQRQTHHQAQSLQQEATRLQVEWRQLLLEHSTRLAPQRIQHTMHDELAMMLPSEANTIFISLQ